MENLFPRLTQIVTDGVTPMLSMLVNWLMSDGNILGLNIIVLPLLGKVISIFFKRK